MANHRKSAGFVLTWTSPRKCPGRPFVVLSSPPSQIAEAVVVPSSVLAHPPRWLSAAQLHPAPAPLLRDWLFDHGSLTRRLTTLSAERFAVQPLQQGWQVLRADECAALQVPADILMAADDPVIPLREFERIAGFPNVQVELAAHGGHCGFIENARLDGYAERWVASRLIASAS